jgi:hypothetical protein
MIKLEVGKFYKDGDGDKIEIIKKLKSGRFVGVLVDSVNFKDDVDTAIIYEEDGDVAELENNSYIASIISEWRDSVTVTRYINISDANKLVAGGSITAFRLETVNDLSRNMHKVTITIEGDSIDN